MPGLGMLSFFFYFVPSFFISSFFYIGYCWDLFNYSF